MTPRPEASTNGNSNGVHNLQMSGYRLSHPPPGDEVVISGISGKFPASNSVHEFGEKLLNEVELVKDDPMGWVYVHPEIPGRIGRINNPNHFDASFFGIHFNQAQSMDPMSRIMLEKAYEAIIDAGVNPASLKGTKTAVYVGTCYSESERTWIYDHAPINGFGASGCHRSMLANRISYWLDTKGPSFAIDSACSSSLYSLELAYKAIRDGECDSAIIGACNLCLHPCLSLQFSRMGVMSPEGRCRSFDNNANGYVRAEAIVAVYVQKAKDARRIYAQAVHVKTNCDGHKEHGITYPSGNTQMKLFKELYAECGVNPNEVEFIDAHATGTRVGDPEELKAIDSVFCNGRRGTLKVGSVKTNMGHGEPASGMCSLAKMCVAYNTGYIPPNLNFDSPREGVEALALGRIEVVTKKTPWNRGLSGINSFGFGGSNAHVLLRNIAKSKVNNGSPKDSLTRLVCVSGRTESAVKRILDDLISRPHIDAEQIGLIHAIHEQEISRHDFRGYSLIRPQNIYKEATREIKKYFPSAKKPIGFIFSGLGSQWPGLGRDLMQITAFVKVVERCDKVLKPKGVDILRILCDKDAKSFDNVLNSFIGIAVVHIGLCDVLKSIGIEPDFFIGHGIGELGCAYADSCLSAEEVILAAYYSGLAVIEGLSVKGSMAEVGLGYDTLKNFCPQDIDIACHNSFESSIISGPAESVKLFVARLQGRKIHAKELPCSNIAFHSRYIQKSGIILSNYLKKLLPSSKMRSSRWLSTSDLLDNCTEKMYSASEYHTNNLLYPVLFEETSRLIPKNAIVIEVGSNGWLQTIRKRFTHINLIKRGAPNQFEYMLTAFGTLYHNGVNLKLAKLYPEIKFPVSSGTPMLANLVEWDHREDWFVPSFNVQDEIRTGERLVTMNITDKDNDYMAGHVVDGRNLYPATGYLILVWETLALMQGQFFAQVPVTFEDVKFIRATNIPKAGNLEFIVMIQKGSGNFEITESGSSIVSGRIYVNKNSSKMKESFPEPKEPTGIFSRKMVTKDIYKELRLRGYNYTGEFKGIAEANVIGTKGELMWTNNWVTFLDTMMQMSLFNVDTRGLFVPTSVRKLLIDTTKHYTDLMSLPQDQQQCLPVTVYREIELIRSGGVEIRGLSISPITKRNLSGDPVLEENVFIPFFPMYKMKTKDVVRNSIQLILESVQGNAVKAVELIDSETSPNNEPLTPLILEALEDLPLIQANVSIISDEKLNIETSIPVQPVKFSADMNALIFVGSNILKRPDIVQQLMIALNKKGYILSRENLNSELKSIPETLELIASCKTNNEQLVLLKRPAKDLTNDFMIIKQSDNKFSWIEKLKIMMQKSQKIVLVSEGEELNGILGLVNCLRREPGGNIISCLAIMDKHVPKFNKDLPLYKEQLTKQLGINVYKNGQWGSYRHLWLDPLQTVKADHAYLNVLTHGDLSSFRWFQGGLRMDVDKPIIHVYYAPLVFRDTLIASGRIAQESYAKGRLNNDCAIGTEYSGRTLSGTRVMGMCANRCLANMVAADPKLLWNVPDNWTLAEAATVPNAYSTVLYAFFMRTTLRPGSRVLIHAGGGGVGQAAINVCLFYGCEVFTTVGSQAKRDFIRKTFPEIQESHIGNSRDLSFEDMVLKETNGEGVDYVLNSLAEDKLMASVRCLAPRGKFLEIGKFDILNNNELGLHLFNNEQCFQGIMMDFVLNGEIDDHAELNQLVFDHIKNGCIKPLCLTTFETDEVEKAFRFMSAGKHIGKVIIKIRDEEKDRPTKVEPLCLDAIPRYHCYPEYSYIVVGGLGGFGLELADWLVLRGARKIILNSRRGITNGYQTFRIKTWTDYGVQVVISQDDVTTKEGCIKMLQNAETLGPVKAIFNLAVILKDAIFENQTPEMFQISLAPKAFATKLLDEESRKRCPQLKNFVVFSSVSCGRGNAGQTNYGMANSIMERICEERQKAGYPALAIQWGAVGEVGLVADMQQEHMELEIGGTLQQRISSCLSVMDNFLSQPAAVVSSMVVAEKKVGSHGDCDILGTVGAIMGLKDLKTVSHQVTLTEMGMDSIMAVEIRQVLEREFEIITTPQNIRTMTFARLLQLVDKIDTGDKTSAPTSDIKDSETGLDLFLKNLGEEVEKTETCVRMPTLCSEDENNNNNNGPQMFMIPGIEGMAVVFEPLTKKLNCEATVLQMGYEYSGQDALSFAKKLLEPIKPTLCCQPQFVLLGYSFGTLVALDLAAILESQGHIGKVILIDGSPEFLHQYIQTNLRSLDSKEYENGLMSLLYDTISPNNKANILHVLQGVSTWEEKLDIFVKLAKSDVTYSEAFLKKIVNAIFGRTQSIAEHTLSVNRNKLKSTGYLLRTKNVQTGIVVAEDYSINNYFENSVRVFMLEGNHSSIIVNDDCANIINKIVGN